MTNDYRHTSDRDIHRLGRGLINQLPEGLNMKPSWDKDCEKTLSERWQITRKLWEQANYGVEQALIEQSWHDRLDRLYLNTAMPASTYAKFNRLADKLFIE